MMQGKGLVFVPEVNSQRFLHNRPCAGADGGLLTRARAWRLWP